MQKQKEKRKKNTFIIYKVEPEGHAGFMINELNLWQTLFIICTLKIKKRTELIEEI
jgi:hypothetical protein